MEIGTKWLIKFIPKNLSTHFYIEQFRLIILTLKNSTPSIKTSNKQSVPFLQINAQETKRDEGKEKSLPY